MVGSLDRLRETTFGMPRASDEPLSPLLEEPASHPTPGEVFGQIGLVFGICLGLGLLARVVVALVGVY